MAPLVYLHGFASGPDSLKGRHCRAWAEARGVAFHAPDLNVPTFESMTVTAQVETVETLIGRLPESAVLAGSSLGGLVAAAVAQRAGERAGGRRAGLGLRALVLLAPAFGFARRRLESEVWADYRRRGSLLVWHSAKGHLARLGPQLLEDLPAWANDDHWRTETPTYILHGRRDESVPPEESRAFAGRNPTARLSILDDEHALSAPSSLDALTRTLTEAFDQPAL